MIDGNGGNGVGGYPMRRMQVMAAIVGLAVLLVGGAHWSGHEAAPAQDAALQPSPAAEAEPTAAGYYPAHYLNQATESTEHIQAF